MRSQWLTRFLSKIPAAIHFREKLGNGFPDAEMLGFYVHYKVYKCVKSNSQPFDLTTNTNDCQMT